MGSSVAQWTGASFDTLLHCVTQLVRVLDCAVCGWGD